MVLDGCYNVLFLKHEGFKVKSVQLNVKLTQANGFIIEIHLRCYGYLEIDWHFCEKCLLKNK